MTTESTKNRQPPPPPGSLGLPLIGETLEFKRDPNAFMAKRVAKYGAVFKTQLLFHQVVCVAGRDGFALLRDAARFERNGANPWFWRWILSWTSSPLIDGATHQRRKRLLLEAFTPKAIDEYVAPFESVVAAYIDRWIQRQRFGWVDELQRLSFDLCDAVFIGVSPAFGERQEQRGMDSIYAGLQAVPIPLRFTAFGRALAARDQFRSRIGERLARIRRDPGVGAGGNCVLERAAAARIDGFTRLSDAELEVELVQCYIASYAALYSTLAATIIALTENPQLRDRCVAEVGHESGNRPFGASVLRRLEFIKRFTQEVRRFYPITATTLFQRARSDVVFNGVRIERGWRALGCINASMQDPTMFPDAERFDPDRFSAPRASAEVPTDVYVAHGGGTVESGHHCTGEHLADMLLVGVTAELVLRLTWELPKQDLRLRPVNGIPVPADGLSAIVQRRA